MNQQTSGRYRCIHLLFYTFVTLAMARPASAADSLTVSWDPSPDPDVTGYFLYIGTVAGDYTYRFDVGGATSYVFSSAVAGTRYYFRASSYNAERVEGYPTAEISGYSNAPPVLTNPGPQYTAPGTSVTLQLVGSDPLGQPVSYKATGLPAGLTLTQSTGLIAGTPTTIGNYSVTATVMDGVLSTSQAFTWTIGNNGPPALTQPANQTTTLGVPAALQLTASDPEGKPITYGATVLPAGLTLNTTTGLISGTPTTVGTTSVTVTASDGALSSSRTFTWTVSSTATDKAPTLTNPGDQTTATGTAVKLQLVGSDPEGKAVTYAAAGLPAGLSISSGTGLISGTPTAAAAATVTAYANDGALNSSPTYFKWTVATNKPPTLTNPGNQTTVVGKAVSLKLAGKDPEGKPLQYIAPSLPAGLMVDWSTGIISGTVTTPGVYNASAVVSDGSLFSSWAFFTWTVVKDTTGPTVTIASSSVSRTARSVTLKGTASDNVGVTAVSWASSAGTKGSATGLSSWTAVVPLVKGKNVITISARDAGGNVGTTQISVTF